jgi:hypothetical protein
MKSLEPYHSGKQILVESCQRVSISTYLHKAKEKIKKELVTAEIKMDNMNIDLIPSKTAYEGVRYWFKCPLCTHRTGTLFVHPLTSTIGCRRCLGLEYRSRRYKGMIEDLNSLKNIDKAAKMA